MACPVQLVRLSTPEEEEERRQRGRLGMADSDVEALKGPWWWRTDVELPSW